MITVNPSTRQFTIPGADLVFGVTDDSGSEVKYFKCPRYVGNNIDVAGSFVRINYRNAGGETDSYLVNDIAVDGDNVTFSWELAPKVTDYKGQVKFVMCVVGPDLKVKWHTTTGTGQIYEGLEPDQSHVEDETSDVVAALITMVESQTAAVKNEGATQVQAVKTAAQTSQTAAVTAIETAGVAVRESIPSDYTALSDAMRHVAPGIICEAAGKVVAVNDASNMPMQGLRIFGRSTQDGAPSPDAPVEIESIESPAVMVGGKNLIPQLSAYSGHGITITENPDGTSTINGATTNALGYKGNSVFLPAGTYTLKCNRALSASTWLSISNTPLMIFPGETKKTFTLDSGYHWLYFYANAGVTFNNYVLEAQLEFGGADTEFAPYEGQLIATNHALRGIPVTSGGNYTDSDGQQWICDEVDLERGVYVSRTKLFDLSGLKANTWYTWGVNYSADGITGFYHFFDDDVTNVIVLSNIGKYSIKAWGGVGVGVGIGTSADGDYFIVSLPNEMLADTSTNAKAIESFLAFIADAKAVMLAAVAPIETPLSEAEIAAYRALHTNKPNTTIINDAGAHMAVTYVADTKLYIDNKIAALAVE